jgi:hypothetical protein
MPYEAGLYWHDAWYWRARRPSNHFCDVVNMHMAIRLSKPTRYDVLRFSYVFGAAPGEALELDTDQVKDMKCSEYPRKLSIIMN